MKKILSLLLAATMTVTSAGFVMAEEDTVKLYVAPNGNDDAAGTIEKPLKTLEGARLAVRAVNDGTKRIEVIFRGGEYAVDKTTAFAAADSGTREYPIIYKAYEGETPVFKGSVELDVSKAKRVTDEEVLAKMYENVRNKVVEIDLAAQGITKEMLRDYTKTFSTEKNITGGEVNGLYSNGVPQTLSEWPNGFGNYSTWDSAPDSNTLHYTDTEPHRWGEAKQLYIGGYNAYDFQYVRKSVVGMNIEANTITTTGGGGGGFTSAQSRRWKVYNLLEEIDVPGEYYIDSDNMKLYWYPENGLRDVKLELAVLRSTMVTVNNAQNIRFENLVFTKTNNTVVSMKQVNNIDFIGCTLKDVAQSGIYVYSDLWAETDKDYWQRNNIDGSYNCDFTDCRFENIGRHAMEINGGNVDTLTSSNNRIENCIFTRCAQLAKNATTVMLSGVGIKVKNNEFSDLPFHAINIWGNDHEISYNEIFDVIQESDDCGAIYAGRNTLHRGNEIAYNYIHSVKPVRKLVYNFQGAIYLDDSIGGMDIHHNIINGANVDLIVNGGVDFNFANNTMIDINTYNMRVINGGIAQNNNSGGAVFTGHMADEELYYSRYKNLRQLVEWGRVNARDERMAKFTSITGNLSVNTADESIGTNTIKYGKVKNNTRLEECADFVNPEKQDYRLKNGSASNTANPDVLNEDFDLSLIGLQDKAGFVAEEASFTQISPKNGADGVNSNKVDFKWQDARGANRYKLIVATDAELKNIVHEETSYYNVVSVEGLKNDTVYYWKVIAENISREDSSEWQSSGPVFSFRTSLYETIDTSYLGEVLKQTEQNIDTLDVGENPGQYPQSRIDSIKALINLSGIIANARIGTVSQKNIDDMASSLSGSLSSLGITNKGFIDLSEYFLDKTNWNREVEIKDGTVTASKEITGSNNFGVNDLQHMAGSVLYSFDAKMDLPSGSWYLILGENKDNKTNPFAGTNVGYSFLFKKATIELQASSGTANSVETTAENRWANDGEFHNFRYGYITTEIGNFVLLYIDGEPVIEYFDVINPKVNAGGTFMAHAGGGVEVLTMKKAENVGTKVEFDAIINEGYYKAAKTVIDAYDVDGVIALDADGKKAFTPEGVYNIDGTQNINSKLYMKAEVIDKVFGTTSTQNGNAVTVKSGEGQATVTLGENGLISLEDVMKQLGRGYMYSAEQNIVIIGDIIFMNNLKAMAKTRQLMDIMTTMEAREDYIFNKE